MDKKITFSVMFLLLFAGLFANQPGTTKTKLDLRTYKKLQSGDISSIPVHLLVKGDLKKVEALTIALGGTYKYGYNNISSISLPENKLMAFSSEIAVEKIEKPNAPYKFLMDSARIKNNIDSAQQGFSPLTTDLTGKGVIIGIIDGGIYFQHPDFQNPDGTTRVRYIWDQTVTGGSNVPQPYAYGNQWSWIDINSGNCTAVEQYLGNCADFGHGSCVAGIAAGNGSSVSGNPNLAGKYVGVAPESELIIVNIGSGTCTSQVATSISDAVDYIFKKADALGMPCVINTSVGTYYGSHDGIDMTTQLIESLLDQRNGRVLVAAAGNTGDVPYHIRYEIPSDSAYTFFKFSNSDQHVYIDWWADTADFNNANFAIGCNDTLGNDLGRTRYLNVLTDFNPPPGQSIEFPINLFSSSALLGTVDLQTTLDQGRYHVEVQVTTTNHTLLWRLQTTGSGRFDLWSSESIIGSSDIVDAIQGVTIQYPQYRHPDNQKTIVTSWQCSDKVITVGNYSNRTGYLDADSNFVDLTGAPDFEVPGKRFHTSSFGPTRDNRLKPDIMATGSTTICTGDLNDIGLKLTHGLRYKVGLGSKHERNGGTSMSSPIVAGIAALYLQKRPTATYDEIKKAIIWTANKDSFTGPTANNEYGNGKVNAFQALTNAGIIYGAMDTACINYYYLANVDSGGCVAKVYGCTDTSATNYDSTANISAGNCTYLSTVTNNINADKLSVSVMPNPFTGQTVFKFNGLTNSKGVINIYDALGRQVDEVYIVNDKNEYTYRNSVLAKGFYTYCVSTGDKYRYTGKLIVQ